MTNENPPIGIQQSINSLVAEKLQHLLEARNRLEYVITTLTDAHTSKPYLCHARAALERAIDELKPPYPDAGLPTREY